MAQDNQSAQPEFNIQKIYTKDLSFESPNTPEIFKTETQLSLDLNLDTRATKLEEDIFEIVLTVTVTAKSETSTAYLCEVKQAGIFTLKGFDSEQMNHLQGSVCPNILYPYAREVVSDLVVRGSFHPVFLAPINFDALYAQELERQKAESEGSIQ